MEQQIQYKIIEDIRNAGKFLLYAYDSKQNTVGNKPICLVGEIRNNPIEVYGRRHSIIELSDFKCFEVDSNIYYRNPVQFKLDFPTKSLFVLLKCPCCGLINKEYLK